MKIQKISNNYQSYITKNNTEAPKYEASRTVEKSLYNSTCPLSANYFNPSFGKLSPQSALKRNEMLKNKFAQNGFEYILPKDTWNSKKIFATLDKIGNKFDELVQKKELSAQSLSSILKTILPASVAASILVKDFGDLRQYLESIGYNDEDINTYMTYYNGLQVAEEDKSTIYLHTEDSDAESERDKISLKTTFLHELEHALTSRCTNIKSNDKIRLKEYYAQQKSSTNETEFYNKIFMAFERKFVLESNGNKVDLNKQTLFDHTPYFTEEEMFEDMDEEINKLRNKEIATAKTGVYSVSKLISYGLADKETLMKAAPEGILDDNAVEILCKKNPKNAKLIKSMINNSKLPDDAFSSKTFWEYLQHLAKDEKEAYKTESVIREYYGDKNQPTDYELQSLMYAQMEKFFKQKAKAAAK